MPSKLLSDLLLTARETRDRNTWAKSVCRAASHYARQGSGDEAIKSIAEVRSKFQERLEPEVACWLMLAAGILHFFQTNSKMAYDRCTCFIAATLPRVM